MSTTIVKENYPELTVDAGKSGKRIAAYLNYGASASYESPKWILFGGVTSSALSVSVEVSTTQTKDTGMWAEGAISAKSAELSLEYLYKPGNVAQEALKSFVYDDEISNAKHALDVAVVDLDTKEYTRVWLIPNSLQSSAAAEDMVKDSMAATVVGVPNRASGFVEPE